MITIIKLIDMETEYTYWEKAPLHNYLTDDGIKYFEEQRWKHAFVKIPASLVKRSVREHFICYVSETEESTVGEVAAYRAHFPSADNLLIRTRSGKSLYYGKAKDCPPELCTMIISRSMYNNFTMMLEVADA